MLGKIPDRSEVFKFTCMAMNTKTLWFSGENYTYGQLYCAIHGFCRAYSPRKSIIINKLQYQ